MSEPPPLADRPPNPNPNFALPLPDDSLSPFPLEDNYDFDLSLEDINFEELFPPSDYLPYISDFAPDPNSGSSEASRDQDSGIEIYLNPGRCDSGDGSTNCAPVSSHGSMNATSPDSGVDQKLPATSLSYIQTRPKMEEESNKSTMIKRKEVSGDEVKEEERSHKYHRSENGSFGSVSEEEEKKRARLLRNRESAQLSRQRKKHYVGELEEKVRVLHSTIAELNGKVSYFMAENASLRHQLSGGGIGVVPPMYPPVGSVAYPWMPCPPYVVKSQGSQVPLVPIPRLKPHQPVLDAKNKKGESKKGESKKSEGRTKKVASVSFLGLLFFVMLFGGLVPLVNVRFGGGRENSFGLGSERFYDRHQGRILVVSGHSNASEENMGVGFPNEKHCERGGWKHSEPHIGNGSEPLFASLYVPRNDKLVKIDGNLIIHSVLASEKAVASRDNSDANRNKETGLAIRRDLRPALAIPDASNRLRHPHLYGGLEQQKALTSGSDNTLKDQFRSSVADGKMQQWFREGLVGPMMSSGMCTEVFQFDVSPTEGAIVPASSVTNITTKQQHNATKPSNGRNRRTRLGRPDPFRRPKLNVTGEPVRRNSQKTDFQTNNSVSSTVVSVLVDPRDAGEIEVDSMIRMKSLSRVFVVVLLDSVKYVTYSCTLPRTGPNLVTT